MGVIAGVRTPATLNPQPPAIATPSAAAHLRVLRVWVRVPPVSRSADEPQCAVHTHTPLQPLVFFKWWSISISRYVVHLVTCRIHHDSGDVVAGVKKPPRRLFQVQTTLEPAAACALSRRTCCVGEASADDEAFSPGSGAVQVSGRWKRAILCPTTRPVRTTYKSGCEIRTTVIHVAFLAVRSPLALSELRTTKKATWTNSVLALTSPGPLRPPADDLPPRRNRAGRVVLTRGERRVLPARSSRAATTRGNGSRAGYHSRPSGW